MAGPDPQDGHAPGTVFVAVAGPAAGERGRAHLRLNLPGDRSQVRRAAVGAALGALRDLLDADVEGGSDSAAAATGTAAGEPG